MKKLLGISLVAVLAATPLMASAADLTSDQMAKANIVTGTDDKQVAAVSYVKGAYKELGDAINTKQDKITAQNKLSADLVEGVAAASAVEALAGRVTTAENDIDALETRVGTAESDIDTLSDTVATKAAASDVTALDTRVTAAEGKITTAENDIDALETKVGDASSGLVKDVTDLKNSASTYQAKSDSTVAAKGNYINAGTGVAANLTALDTQVKTNTDAIATKAAASDVTALAGRVTTAEGAINEKADQTALDTEIADRASADAALQTAIDAKADADDLTALGTRVTTAEGAITTLNANAQTEGSVDYKIAQSNTTLTNAIDAKADQADLDALTTRVGAAESDIDALQTASATHATKTGVTATITASSVSGTVPVLATWGNSTASTAPITASLTGATYRE